MTATTHLESLTMEQLSKVAGGESRLENCVWGALSGIGLGTAIGLPATPITAAAGALTGCAIGTALYNAQHGAPSYPMAPPDPSRDSLTGGSVPGGTMPSLSKLPGRPSQPRNTLTGR